MKRNLLIIFTILLTLFIVSCDEPNTEITSHELTKIYLPNDMTDDDISALQQIRVKSNGELVKTIYSEEISSEIKHSSTRDLESGYYIEVFLPNGNHELSIDSDSLTGKTLAIENFKLSVENGKVIKEKPIICSSVNKSRVYISSDVGLAKRINIIVKFTNHQGETFTYNLGSGQDRYLDNLSPGEKYTVHVDVEVLKENPDQDDNFDYKAYGDILDSYTVVKNDFEYIYNPKKVGNLEIQITNEVIKKDGRKVTFEFNSNGYFKYFRQFEIGFGLVKDKDSRDWSSFKVPYLGFTGNKKSQEVFFPKGYIQTNAVGGNSFSRIGEQPWLSNPDHETEDTPLHITVTTSSAKGENAWLEMVFPPIEKELFKNIKHFYFNGTHFGRTDMYKGFTILMPVKPGKQDVQVLLYEDFNKPANVDFFLKPIDKDIYVKKGETRIVEFKVVYKADLACIQLNPHLPQSSMNSILPAKIYIDDEMVLELTSNNYPTFDGKIYVETGEHELRIEHRIPNGLDFDLVYDKKINVQKDKPSVIDIYCVAKGFANNYQIAEVKVPNFTESDINSIQEVQFFVKKGERTLQRIDFAAWELWRDFTIAIPEGYDVSMVIQPFFNNNCNFDLDIKKVNDTEYWLVKV